MIKLRIYIQTNKLTAKTRKALLELEEVLEIRALRTDTSKHKLFFEDQSSEKSCFDVCSKIRGLAVNEKFKVTKMRLIFDKN